MEASTTASVDGTVSPVDVSATETNNSNPNAGTSGVFGSAIGSVSGNGRTATFSVLCDTLYQLEIRKEVEDVVQSMLTDIEQSEHLKNQLVMNKYENEIETVQNNQLVAYQEAVALENEGSKYRTSLADDFVRDLISLSDEINELHGVKHKYESIIVQYNELKEKLCKTEQELLETKQQQKQQQQQQQQQQSDSNSNNLQRNTTTTTENEGSGQQQMQSQAQTDNSEASVDVMAKSSPSVAIAKVEQNNSTPPQPSAEQLQEQQHQISSETTKINMEEATQKTSPPETTTNPVPAPAPLVAIDSDIGDIASPGLEDMEMEVLMRVFGFLDAIDILNTAQVNISMYSRVDSLFGFGMGGGGGGSVDDAAAVGDQSVAASTISTATDIGTSTTAATSSNPTIASIPPPAIAKQQKQQKPAPTPTSTDSATATSKLGGGGLFGFGILPNPLGVGAARSNAGNNSNESSGDSYGAASSFLRRAVPQKNYKNDQTDEDNIVRQVVQQSKQIQQQTTSSQQQSSSSTKSSTATSTHFSKAMADSMASKLNNQEIHAILSMTANLRQAQAEVTRLANTHEELEGKLTGTEAVKDFLIKKVRDLENVVNNNNETEKKITQQIASDQEVIAFLDARVQELEKTARKTNTEKTNMQNELNIIKKQNEKKVIILGDMLQFEREKFRENEKEWKATKKVLVKEIKNCRSQIIALQAERDGYREQNDILKKSVLSTPTHHPKSPNHNGVSI